MLDAFARSRLVVLGDGTAEIAHDVLLQAWPRLRDWLEEDQSSLILYGQLAEDTVGWRQNGKEFLAAVPGRSGSPRPRRPRASGPRIRAGTRR